MQPTSLLKLASFVPCSPYYVRPFYLKIVGGTEVAPKWRVIAMTSSLSTPTLRKVIRGLPARGNRN